MPKRGFPIPVLPTPARSEALELLDSPHTCEPDLGANLHDIRRLNSWFGGTRLAVSYARRLLAGCHRARVLDVGTGSGDVLLALSRWGARAGIGLELVGVDISPEVVREARRFLDGAPVTVAEGDARSLPWPDGSFDLVSCCLALHHFPPEEAVVVLRELDRVASRAVLVTDLERSYLAYACTWLATHTIARTRLTRHDGPLSVLRAYTRNEMRALAAGAGIGSYRVHSHAFFRQVLVAEEGTAQSDA